ncbi:hypothetical protein [Bordetella sp. FB-8]|uniref:hypothetical protein n=1 Tax=Bordetella sp. FB-8 TaxID=1159870 RepID=UPI0012DED879|nr:hypothetical protein [Bordetella sp. FB-8]
MAIRDNLVEKVSAIGSEKLVHLGRGPAHPYRLLVSPAPFHAGRSVFVRHCHVDVAAAPPAAPMAPGQEKYRQPDQLCLIIALLVIAPTVYLGDVAA